MNASDVSEDSPCLMENAMKSMILWNTFPWDVLILNSMKTKRHMSALNVNLVMLLLLILNTVFQIMVNVLILIQMTAVSMKKLLDKKNFK